MNKIEPLYTEDQLLSLKYAQEVGRFFTCCSHDSCDRRNQPNHGVLIPHAHGFECPCGKMPTQTWCHEWMTNWKWVLMLPYLIKDKPEVIALLPEDIRKDFEQSWIFYDKSPA